MRGVISIFFYRAGCTESLSILCVISNILPLWKKECQYTASSRGELENTPPSAICTHQPLILSWGFTLGQFLGPLGANCLRGRVFQ